MAKARLEWARLSALGGSGGAAVNQPLELFGAAAVLSLGSSAMLVPAPVFAVREPGVEGAAFARITVISGAVNVAWGDAPAASETGAWRVEAGAYVLAPVKSGQAVSLIEAADPPGARASSPLRALATSRSGSVAAGGTAQDLMAANPDRNGWLIQNQSAANLYVRSKGEAGATVATADGFSLLIPPGGYYEPPKITPHALSILGPMTGQVFFAEEW